MKTLKAGLLASVLILSVNATKKNNEAETNIKKIDKVFVKITENVYASKYEVSNLEYKGFLYTLKSNNNDLYNLCMYDSSLWETQWNISNAPMKDKYHWHPAYNHYPIVNITYHAAVEYCKWLTEMYNLHPQRQFKKVLFRLPTEEEWIKAAKIYPDGKLPWYGEMAYDEKKNFKANVKFHSNNTKDNSTDYIADKAMYTASVSKFSPNEIGIYNIIGNVSEMITLEGKAKGGNWNSYIEECFANQTQEYKGKDTQVGFRVFMEIMEE